MTDAAVFTEHKDAHKQHCMSGCGELITVADWFGGGSHYWHLKCPRCQREYSYDTYRFTLENTGLQAARYNRGF